MKSLLRFVIGTTLVLGFSPAAMASPNGFTFEDLRNDVRSVMHTLDVDFWKAVDETGKDMDFSIDPPSVKNANGILLLGAGSGLLSMGVIKELAMRAYPNVNPPVATSAYHRYLGRSFKKLVAKLTPKSSQFYKNWANAQTNLGVLEADQAFAKVRFASPWVSRTLSIGSGTAMVLSALAFLLYVDEELPRLHPKMSGGPSSLEQMRDLFNQGRTEDEVLAMVGQSSVLIAQVHGLAQSLAAAAQAR